ncbi:hypothetical protein, partial [Enterovibrio norvegicus]|uniref:hypothetical protein n=1 Tax=Enterovibrio norvegicus TaxID=188144 RepID=UPI001A7E08C2
LASRFSRQRYQRQTKYSNSPSLNFLFSPNERIIYIYHPAAPSGEDTSVMALHYRRDKQKKAPRRMPFI